MSEYVISNEIVTLAVNLEDGSWRVIGNESHLGCKYFWYEETSGQLMTSALGRVFLLERAGEEADGPEAIPFEVETPGVALEAGQEGVAQRAYFDINTRGQELEPLLVVDDGDVVPLPRLVRSPKRQVVEVPAGGVPGRIFGLRLRGRLLRRVDLYEMSLDVSVGVQEHQAK